MKTNKYNYIKVIQQNCGYGWEDVSEYEANSNFIATGISNKLSPKGIKETVLNHDLREYRLTGYATRVINRRELNN